MSHSRAPLLVYAKLLATAFFWGGTFIAGRVVSQAVEPYTAAFLRFVLASTLLLFLVKKRNGSFPRVSGKQLLWLSSLGFFGALTYNVFFFSGLKIVSAGRASVIIACNPVSIALFSACLLKERLRLQALFGIGLSISGALVVITQGKLSNIWATGIGTGELLILGCVFSWTAYTLIGKLVLDRISPLVSVAYSSVAGTLMLALPAAYETMKAPHPQPTLEAWVALAYLSLFGTVLGFVWYYQGISAIGPVRASLFINFVPVCTILIAFVLLDEPVTLSLVVGGSLVCLGVYLTNRSRPREETRT